MKKADGQLSGGEGELKRGKRGGGGVSCNLRAVCIAHMQQGLGVAGVGCDSCVVSAIGILDCISILNSIVLTIETIYIWSNSISVRNGFDCLEQQRFQSFIKYQTLDNSYYNSLL